MLNKLLESENINAAIEHILQGNVKVDTRGMAITDLPDYWHIHGEDIISAVLHQEYLPYTVHVRPILQSNGKERPIAHFAATDLLLLRAAHQLLYPVIDPDLSVNSYAYRMGISVADAIKQARYFLQNGHPYAVKLDINNYFASIPHNLLLNMLVPYVDAPLIHLIEHFIKADAVDDTTEQKLSSDRGIHLGSPLSPLLANLYLTPLDRYLESRGIPFVRFSDDITLFAKNQDEGINRLQEASDFLLSELHLSVNRKKCTISDASTLELLGYHFYFVRNKLEAARIRNYDAKQCYTHWSPLPLSDSSQPHHFLQNGILTRKHMAILYENEQYKRVFPSVGLEVLHLHASVTLTPDFLAFAAKMNLRICYYNEYGHYIGAFLPAESQQNNRHMMAQARSYLNPRYRLAIAKRLEDASIFNMYQNVRYYRERKNETLLESESAILDCLKQLKRAATVSDLMLLEARARQIYYRAFPLIITNPDFRFTERTIRPPRDALNALISFGNTLLYQLISDDIYGSQLDIRISFVHSADGARSENLHLDLADIFKPILIDRIIFTMINRREIDSGMFQKHADGGVYLTRKGKRLFIEHFNRKLNQTITHQGEKKTYRKLLSDEVYALQRYFESDIDYHPYKYR